MKVHVYLCGRGSKKEALFVVHSALQDAFELFLSKCDLVVFCQWNFDKAPKGALYVDLRRAERLYPFHTFDKENIEDLLFEFEPCANPPYVM